MARATDPPARPPEPDYDTFPTLAELFEKINTKIDNTPGFVRVSRQEVADIVREERDSR
jgi:hypothetical protein